MRARALGLWVVPGLRVLAYFSLACGHYDYCCLAHEPLCRDLCGNVGVVTNGGYVEYAGRDREGESSRRRRWYTPTCSSDDPERDPIGREGGRDAERPWARRRYLSFHRSRLR